MSVFTEKVLYAVASVPKGSVVSYGQVALMVGVPRAARQVGRVLHFSERKVPWWRVINNAGRISTNCAEHTALMQKTLLEKEGVYVSKSLTIDIEKYRYRPTPDKLKKLKLENTHIQKIIEKYLTF